jgi:hypothetical protein
MTLTANLRARLDGRVSNLFTATSAGLPSQLASFVEWLQGDPYLAALLATLPDQGVSGEEWIQENIKWEQDIAFPPGEDAMVSCCWLVTRHVAASADVGAAAFGVTHDDPGVKDQVSANRAFLQTFVAPVVGWLRERILTDDHLLHSLERYARGAAWFRRDELRGVYEADTSRGEATLDRDLRRHLFEDGIDFPFSQARGPSGQPDVIVPDDEANPLPLEVKVYDPPRSRGDAAVRSGFVQAIEYAHDYRRADAYLAVFDVSEEGLSIAGDDPTSHPPYVRSSGVTVFVVVIPIGPTQPASGRGTVTRKTPDAAFFTES